ncbi:HET-domain-containing protein [Astrocystis sublimbata]|nr:HET-domain-containing protein [Astrocystis sublimbata]
MRLLHTSELVLKEFFEPRVPKYAILSHTWEEEEVLFEDIQRPDKGEEKYGSIKVRAACELAKGQGYEYIWIDTCCINKTSSAELTEAINSMYRWYEQSDVCYAFLGDVDEDKFSLSPPGGLHKARWFTRGWTLQELLAPDYVEFYDSTWHFIGNKKDSPLCSIIADITKIDENILRGEDVLKISIARRMYWASRRETTRIEDLAYSLLGLFDINMPLIYGEGHKAFRRLQEEILKTTDDQSIFAWWNSQVDGLPVDVLAHAPSDFADSGAVSPYAPFRFNRKTTLITNQGIPVEFPILSLPSLSHTGDSPFEEIEAILDCQFGSAPGTFPTIRLSSVEKGGTRTQKRYYRIMRDMTTVKSHDISDLFTADVIGFDPTQLDHDVYKNAKERLPWSCRVDSVIITRHVPKPKRPEELTLIPWSLSLLSNEAPPDSTPFWLTLFNTHCEGIIIENTYPKERWDESLRQLRVPLLPRVVFEQGYVRRVEGIFNLRIIIRPSLYTVYTRRYKHVFVTLVIGRKSFDRRDSNLKPWCRIIAPPIEPELMPSYMEDFNTGVIDAQPLPSELTHPLARNLDLGVKVRSMEVSGRFYHMVNVYEIWPDIPINADLTLSSWESKPADSVDDVVHLGFEGLG